MKFGNADHTVIQDGNRSIPVDPMNSDYAEILASGAAIEDYVAEAPHWRDARIAAYGKIGDQLDEIYKDIDAWKDRIKTIKEKYPK
tara:strand:- start:1145 stop:1402 length:258 start_codon:yes stop_codon:yes gene_type:complete